MEEILDNFINSIKDILQDNLIAAVLYGSKSSEGDSGSGSDYNLLLAIRDFDYTLLEKLDKKVLRHWIKAGNPAPFILTEQELLKSTDVFPAEFLDIASSHKLLYGKDIFRNIVISDANLRHECEYELRSKLLKLRRQWLMYSKEDKILKDILTGSISSFLSIFRHAVKLSGEAIPAKKLDTLEILQKRCGIDAELFRMVYKIKHSEKGLPAYKADDLMRRYLKEIEKIIVFVDGL